MTGDVRRDRAMAGFSMLELIIVMIIMATLLAAASPSLRGFYSHQQISNVAGQFVALTQFARNAAINEGRIYRLNLDVDARIYGLTVQDGGLFIEPDHPLGMIFDLPDEIEAFWVETDLVASDRQFVTFYPSGRVEPAGIRLIGRSGEVIDVICATATDRFRALSEEESLALQQRLAQGQVFQSNTTNRSSNTSGSGGFGSRGTGR